MAGFNIKKVLALPEVLVADTLYLVKSTTAGLFDLYVSDKDGVTARHIPTKEEILDAAVLFSDEAPALPSANKLWWNTAEGALYIQYNDGAATYWVEAMPSIAVPEFDGTGEAVTMARSDHNHDDTYAKIGANQW